MIEGMNLLKEIYGGLDKLEGYFPLINFEWKRRDKIWLNEKLYDGKEWHYPDLFKNSNESQKIKVSKEHLVSTV